MMMNTAMCVTASAAVKSNVPTLTHVMASSEQSGYGVCGVTSLGDDVFVVRFMSQQKIEVYDAKTFKLQRHIRVPGLGKWQSGIAACARNKCVYISDHDNEKVHRIKPARRLKAVKNWSVASGPQGLSVNSAHNLVVACSEANMIQEYKKGGCLVREIWVGLTRPWHAVQLSTGDYVVSQFWSSGMLF